MVDFLLQTSPYAGLFFLITMSGCGMPIPEEAYIVLAGALAANGQIDPIAGYLACTAGVFAGDLAMYGLGYYRGEWASQRISRLRLNNRLVNKGVKLLEMAQRYRPAAMFLSHFTWGLRPLTHLVIGASKMPLADFLVAELVVASVFTGGCFAAAYYIGEPVYVWLRSSGIGLTIAVVLVGLVATAIWTIRRSIQSATSRQD